MSVLKKFKKKFISKLRRIRKHYRYKVYFPKVYSSYCTEPVQDFILLYRFSTVGRIYFWKIYFVAIVFADSS